MNNKKSNIDPIDESLRFIFLESAKDADKMESAKRLQQILNSEYSVSMSPKLQNSLLEKLNESVSVLSLGELLNDVMLKQNLESKKLAEKVAIPELVVEQLLGDQVFTNNIPVMFLKKIFHALNITFQKAEPAILKTYHILKSQFVVETLALKGMRPAYRKGYYASREASTWAGSTVAGKDLFENEEALKKYLSRLGELMEK
jgi:hypothetical protein